PAAKDVFVQGDATAGASKAAVCYACHGPGGNGAINPQWPKLAGQHAAYLYEQLGKFKSGSARIQ
ncbi:MAG TPA: c-type cytochrome, partial [Dehalococcoidia bacterium]|nr:c-type cytochrome [Dehalococcoidia bacterium]